MTATTTTTDSNQDLFVFWNFYFQDVIVDERARTTATYSLFKERWTPPATLEDQFIVRFANKMMGKALCRAENRFSGQTEIDDRLLSATLAATSAPYEGNGLRLIVTPKYLGYHAKLEMLLKGHPVPIKPYLRAKASLGERISYGMPRQSIKDILFYLGLRHRSPS